MQEVRKLLADGARSIEDLISAGIPRSSAFYAVRRLVENGEANRIEGVDHIPRYMLTTLVPDQKNLQLITEKMNDSNKEVAEQALNDLDELSKLVRIDSTSLVTRIVERFLTHPDQLSTVVRRQASFAKEAHDNETLQQYKKCVLTMRKLASDPKEKIQVREDALLFLQVMNDEKLPDLAFDMILKHDDALDGNTTQFAIVVESICIALARSERWRRKLYDLIGVKDETIKERVKRVLQQSRRPPILTSHRSLL